MAMRMTFPGIARGLGESDDEFRERVKSVKHRRQLCAFLKKLGIKSAGLPDPTYEMVTIYKPGAYANVHAKA